jgi:GT2 family glycosyltransferase
VTAGGGSEGRGSVEGVRTADGIRVGVVLLNWNGGEFTLPCIRSLLEGDLRPWQIVVVDNGSTDGSPELIERAFPTVSMIRSRENLGFAAGNNVGIRALLGDGADLIWILNNDTTVSRSCLGELVAAIQADDDMAVATAKVLFEEPAGRIWYAGAWFSPWTLKATHRGERESDHGQYDETTEVGFVSGCCMLIRASAFREIGMLDERFFIYEEDADWCLRAARAGLRMWYVPAATVVHRVSASMRKNMLGASGGSTPVRTYYLTTRNRIFVIRAHAHRPWQWLTAMAWFVAGCSYLLIGMLVLRRWDKAVAVLRGFRDGFRAALA